MLQSGPVAIPNFARVSAPGILLESNGEAAIDFSNTHEGYVMVCYTAQTQQRLKAQVQGPTTTYTYNLNPGEWTALPLSDQNGIYKISIFINAYDSKYALVISTTIEVAMENQFAPFLHANQYVNYEAAPQTVYKAAQLTQGMTDPLKKVDAIYHFVIKNMKYDEHLAATVTSGYLPNLDHALATMRGICFDYAAMMTGMLRSQGVPTKLVVGYAGAAYHAWINVWSEGTGWIDGVIYFDGTQWQRMDPTFASTGNSSSSILQYIGNGANYAAKYFY